VSADETFKTVDAALDLLLDLSEKLGNHVNGDGFAWHFPRYRAYARALFERSPIKKGARVRLTKTPDINPKDSWGWMHARHFLIKGAMATVADVDFDKGRFSAGLVFDDESFVLDCGPNKGVPQPTQWYVPGSFVFQYLPVKARSVPACRVT